MPSATFFKKLNCIKKLLVMPNVNLWVKLIKSNVTNLKENLNPSVKYRIINKLLKSFVFLARITSVSITLSKTKFKMTGFKIIGLKKFPTRVKTNSSELLEYKK